MLKVEKNPKLIGKDGADLVVSKDTLVAMMSKQENELNEKIKKEADAKKTAGADTEYTRMLTELAKTEIDYKAMSTEEVAAKIKYRDRETDRKSTRLNSSHRSLSRMPSSA